MENLYKYIQLAKLNPQRALTEFNNWLDNHVDWISNFLTYGQLATAQPVVTNTVNNFFHDLDKVMGSVHMNKGISGITSDKPLRKLVKDYDLYQHFHKHIAWIAGKDHHLAKSKEAIQAIEIASNNINKDNSQSNSSYNLNHHESQPLFCDVVPSKAKQLKLLKRMYQKNYDIDYSKWKKIQTKLHKLSKRIDDIPSDTSKLKSKK